MKRFVCLAAFLPLLLPATVFSQILFHDDFQSAGLNRFLAGDLDTKWTLYNDNNNPRTSPDLTYFDNAWKIIRQENGDMSAASLSYFSGNGKKADRWMVTPAIDLDQTENPMLIFRAKAFDANNRDGFEVRLSTEGPEKEHFTVTLESVSHCRNIWTYYSLDLSEYKGQKIHLAFIQNSQDQYILGIDDVIVHDRENLCAFINGFSTPFTMVSGNETSSIKATAQLFNAGSDTITSYTLCKQTDNGDIEKEEVSGVVIAPEATLALTTGFNFNETGFHTLSLWLENINGQDVESPKTSIQVLSANTEKMPKKNLLLEMFSSGMCTACAPWNAVLHPFFISDNANTADNRGNFCVVKYQVNIPAAGDPCVTDQTLSRSNFYGVAAAPSLYMNGRFLPLPQSEELLYQSLRDSILRYHRTTVATGLTARLEREGNTFRIHAEITGYLPDANDYNLVVCLLEDSIQHNRAMHNGEKVFYNVVRQMLPSVTGVSIVPDEIGKTITKDFEYTFDLDNPKVFSSVNNINAVVFLQNSMNREIIQARYLAQGNNDSSVWVNNLYPEHINRQLRVYPNPVSGYCRISFTAPTNTQGRIELVNMQGKAVIGKDITLEEGENLLELDTERQASGLYFVRITSPQGVFIHKLIKR